MGVLSNEIARRENALKQLEPKKPRVPRVPNDWTWICVGVYGCGERLKTMAACDRHVIEERHYRFDAVSPSLEASRTRSA